MKQVRQILVADDNPVNQKLARRLLERCGYRVDTVFNGIEAIAALEKKHFDLVVMDCMMPVLDGYSATVVIRGASPDRFDPQIPIVAMTALATPEDRDKCMKVGMTDYVSKPIVASSFLEKVAGNLGQPVDSMERSRSPHDAGIASEQNEAQREIQDGLLSEMYGSIACEAREWRRQLGLHGDRGDLEGIRFLAHKIRGTADIIGVPGLSAISERVEESAVTGELESTCELNVQLIDALRQLTLEFEE